MTFSGEDIHSSEFVDIWDLGLLKNYLLYFESRNVIDKYKYSQCKVNIRDIMHSRLHNS